MFSQIFNGSGIASINNGARPSTSGAVYWDNSAGCVKVVDSFGNAQSVYAPSQMITLDGPTLTVIEWGKKKMADEQQLNALLEQHPGLKELKDKFDVMLALVQQEVK
jgi:hypothetical protein